VLKLGTQWFCLGPFGRQANILFSCMNATEVYQFPSAAPQVDGTKNEDEIIFLGTGTSEGVPRISCLTGELVTCNVCSQSIIKGNKNRRRNTGLIIRYKHPDGRPRVIMIDVGKFFWHAAMEWLVAYKIKKIDAIILSHEHFDAIGGMDDLRDFTRTGGPIPIYLRQFEYNTIKTMFPYLVKEPPFVYSETVPVVLPVLQEKLNSTTARIIPDLHYVLIDGSTPFVVEGLEFTPLPVLHGGDYVCLGYKFGRKAQICYISDTNLIPEKTKELVKGTDLLILDCLYYEKNYSHFSIDESLGAVRELHPKKTLFIGMSHLMDHDKVNMQLAQLLPQENVDVQLAYDGLRVPVDLLQ